MTADESRARYVEQANERRQLHEPGCPARYPETGGDCDCDVHERVHAVTGDADPDCRACEKAWEHYNMGSGL